MRARSADRSRRLQTVSGASSFGMAAPSPKSDTSTNSDMLDLKLSRKQAESELQQLANRVALLKMEEQKAAEKVSETKSRAAEIQAIKKRNEDKLHQKILQNQTREQQIRSLQAKAAADRDERQKKLSQTKKSMDDARRAIAEKKKQESKRIEDMINNGKAQSELEKRLRAENVRKREEALRLQREQERQEKEQQTMREYARRMEEETERKRQAEDMIALLERQEQELLSRLRRTQEEQQQAYSSLQRSLRS